ncbi:hypothetical protein Cha6605_3852 [Chamaesiphon minutus PCC 6605]|uniref:Uncharacterized protein n=1 Tax=Chamaesiphon minutus (strain ATCC 27169 / PCC 6605) TaxID=1173020 RepID=K9UI99_CHAP6|nr:hypothetical protein Cha6605_3852 [Chamaesiphon minutus PCC 6605]
MVLGLDGYDIGEGVSSPIPFERLFEYCIPRSRHLCLYHESENTNHEITIRSPKSSAHYQGKNLITSSWILDIKNTDSDRFRQSKELKQAYS